MSDRVGTRVVASKLAPPLGDPSFVERPRLGEAMSAGGPCVLLCAMPGYGKSVAVRHWIDRLGGPVAWLNLDGLDHEPSVFWSHLLAAISGVCEDVDDEPALLLQERGSADQMVLTVLIAELARTSRPVTIVLDGLDDQLERRTLDHLGLMVERCRGFLRLVITAHADPALPLGRWRSSGWLTEIREDELRLTDDEAIALARSLDVAWDDHVLRALNELVDGWPLAYRIALGSQWRPDAYDEGWLARDRSMAAQLTGQLLARMSDADRDAALALSVFDDFDPMTCLDLLGSDGSASVRNLLEQGVLISIVDPRVGTMRFRPLMRQLLEAELGWRDPVRRIELHRSAAEIWKRRGDLRSAYRHLAAIGESERSRELLVSAALDTVDVGDVAALRDLAAQLPAPIAVHEPELAVELGAVVAWADGTVAATRWRDRAEELYALDGRTPTTTERSLGVRGLSCMIASLDGDLSTAIRLAESMPHPLPRLTSRIDAHIAFAVARALLAARHHLMHDWIGRVRAAAGPPIVQSAIVPTLQSWYEWITGRLDVATELGERAVRWLDDHDVEAHHWAFDTYITAGWCRLSAGDLVGARHMASRAELAAAVLPGHWNQMQLTYLLARLALAEGDPRRSLSVVEDLRATVAFDSIRPYSDRLIHVASEALIAVGRIDQASALASELSPGIFRQLVRARIEPLSDARLEAVLEERDAWPVLARVQAEVILATRASSSEPPPRLVEVVSECAETGWVLPFLGLGARADRVLRALPLDQLHPRLDDALRGEGQARALPLGEAPRLTPREQALLELLPTHLSYAELGEHLYLSVNTVKSSLKGLYRKLDAHTRAEAVAAGRAHGLI